MSRALRKLSEALTVKARSGTATPPKTLVYETPSIALTDVMKLYERDPTCKASVDLLAASAVGAGFYTTVDANYEKAAEAKRAIDGFNENVNLDAPDFRVASTEFNVDAKTQTLETTFELGREAPLLADYIFALRKKTDHLSRYKATRR